MSLPFNTTNLLLFGNVHQNETRMIYNKWVFILYILNIKYEITPLECLLSTFITIVQIFTTEQHQAIS